ncbi:MAG TPA: RNA polymerase sigma-70 factor [Flavitalea sp.]|nr:RNA polymerase sigma-70 factor [Flavitalea sp.]
MGKGDTYPVTSLLDLIATGDQQAFAKLFDQYRNRVYTVAYRLTQSASIAEEIVEDVFLKIWLKRNDLSAIQNFNAYLLTIARNDCYRALKKIARDYRITSIQEDELEMGLHVTEDYLVEKQYKELLNNAINKLPKQQKLVFRLIKEQGLKREEVADILQLSPETVKFHLSQAVKTIRIFCVQHLETIIGALFFIASGFTV